MRPPSSSQLANGGEICVWRLVPPVGHCNTLYVGSVKAHHWCSSQEDPNTLGSSKYKHYVLLKQLTNGICDRNCSKGMELGLEKIMPK